MKHIYVTTLRPYLNGLGRLFGDMKIANFERNHYKFVSVG